MIDIDYCEINSLPITKKDKKIICDYLFKKEMEQIEKAFSEKPSWRKEV